MSSTNGSRPVSVKRKVHLLGPRIALSPPVEAIKRRSQQEAHIKKISKRGVTPESHPMGSFSAPKTASQPRSSQSEAFRGFAQRASGRHVSGWKPMTQTRSIDGSQHTFQGSSDVEEDDDDDEDSDGSSDGDAKSIGLIDTSAGAGNHIKRDVAAPKQPNDSIGRSESMRAQSNYATAQSSQSALNNAIMDSMRSPRKRAAPGSDSESEIESPSKKHKTAPTQDDEQSKQALRLGSPTEDKQRSSIVSKGSTTIPKLTRPAKAVKAVVADPTPEPLPQPRKKLKSLLNKPGLILDRGDQPKASSAGREKDAGASAVPEVTAGSSKAEITKAQKAAAADRALASGAGLNFGKSALAESRKLQGKAAAPIASKKRGRRPSLEELADELMHSEEDSAPDNDELESALEPIIPESLQADVTPLVKPRLSTAISPPVLDPPVQSAPSSSSTKSKSKTTIATEDSSATLRKPFKVPSAVSTDAVETGRTANATTAEVASEISQTPVSNPKEDVETSRPERSRATKDRPSDVVVGAADQAASTKQGAVEHEPVFSLETQSVDKNVKTDPTSERVSQERPRKKQKITASLQESPSSSAPVNGKLKKKGSKAIQRMRATQTADDDEATPDTSQATRKKRQSNASVKSTFDKTTEVKGPFSAEERNAIQGAFEQTMSLLEVNEAELKNAIQDWRSALAREFALAVQTRVANRHPAAIRKYCQRHYHTYQRGPWTAEEDATLRSAYRLQNGEWTKISASVGRRAEDCRDRWRDFLSRDNAVLGPWSVEEETLLQETVERLLKLSEKDKKQITEQGQNPVVNWNVVAHEMKDTRSAKQCRERYNHLKTRSETATKKQRESFGVVSTETKAWKEASKQITEFGTGDRYDILQEIALCVEDPKQTYSNPMTFWNICAQENKDSRFTNLHRRQVYEDLLQRSNDVAGLTIAEAAAKMAAIYIRKRRPDELQRRFERVTTPRKRKQKGRKSEVDVTEDDEGVQQPSQVKKRNQTSARANTSRRKTPKSAAKIHDSDDEVEADDDGSTHADQEIDEEIDAEQHDAEEQLQDDLAATQVESESDSASESDSESDESDESDESESEAASGSESESEGDEFGTPMSQSQRV